jgi:hypothetical protein
MNFNPRHLGSKEQMWKSFLSGSLAISSLIYLVATENVAVFFSALGLIIIGIIIFMDTNMGIRKTVYLSQNILFFAFGGIVSLIFNAAGFLFLYLGIVVILVVATMLHKFRIRGKIRAPS